MEKGTTLRGLTLPILIIVGLIIAGFAGYHALNSSNNQINLDLNGTITKEPVSFDLEVNNPDDELLVYDKSILVSGKTSPKATIIITNDDLDNAFSASSSGDFSQVVNLNPGLNKLVINAFDDQGNTKAVARTIYYSKEQVQ